MERRNTIQKKLVLDAVNRLACHATAEEIYEVISEENPSVGKGTVYRNLNVLAEEGQIRKIEVPGRAEHFDHKTDTHHHVVCIRCRKMFDVDMEPISDLISQIRDSHGIEFIDYDLIFKGICPDCKKAEISKGE